ncbi:M50 family metallopeptidase [Nocardioides marmoribigeumensis]|uniref:Membrane-associated protease RseP (Regulator of RpoE activity) n=1 Tax=Nocardioides marmoribigeumensis TaxID=433649 RepID=A0ABU2BS16_9ACTN|nr:site-2 protease family protein [Nocardioides marmoribigeumensis]MDR7361413.1 membrane-associated protease RseP (regulator of RpoE activity) [Nocardioides marmoribigeumensis]
MSVLLFVLGVLLFAVGMATSIALHEVGHMWPAKRFGVKVSQYFVGFGRTVWSTRRGETEYGLKALPLGGYVKLVGMLPPAKDDPTGQPRQMTTGLLGQLISDARAAEAEHISPGDEPRLFYRLPWWKKVIVMAGGPMVNILIAFVLFACLFGFHGNPEKVTTTVGTVSRCVVPSTEANRVCTDKDPAAPAAMAGLRPGDKLVSFNGTPVTSWRQMVDLVRDNEAGRAVIVYERDGKQRTTVTNTVVNKVNALDGTEKTLKAGFLGLSPQVLMVKHGPLWTIGQMGVMTKDTVVALSQFPVKVWGVAKAIVGVQERAQDSPISVVGAGRIAGEVSSDRTSPLADRLWFLVTLLGGLNLFLGMFNLVPLLPLDGGHIAGALYEALRRGWARLRRLPDPGYVDVAKLLPVAYVVASVLLVMGMVLIVGDLVAPVTIS